MTTIQPISDVRENLPSIVDSINKYLGRITITVRGIPKAVLISADELESLEETAEVLAIPGMRESIKRGERDLKKGEAVTLKDLDK